MEGVGEGLHILLHILVVYLKDLHHTLIVNIRTTLTQGPIAIDTHSQQQRLSYLTQTTLIALALNFNFSEREVNRK